MTIKLSETYQAGGSERATAVFFSRCPLWQQLPHQLAATAPSHACFMDMFHKTLGISPHQTFLMQSCQTPLGSNCRLRSTATSTERAKRVKQHARSITTAKQSWFASFSANTAATISPTGTKPHRQRHRHGHRHGHRHQWRHPVEHGAPTGCGISACALSPYPVGGHWLTAITTRSDGGRQPRQPRNNNVSVRTTTYPLSSSVSRCDSPYSDALPRAREPRAHVVDKA